MGSTDRSAIALLVIFLLGMAYYVDPFIKRWRREQKDPTREDLETNE